MVKFQCYTQAIQAILSTVKMAFSEMCNSPNVVHSGQQSIHSHSWSLNWAHRFLCLETAASLNFDCVKQRW